jgi:hypothetical protein
MRQNEHADVSSFTESISPSQLSSVGQKIDGTWSRMKNIFGSSSQPAQRRGRTAFSHVPAAVEVMEPRQLLSAATVAPNDTAALDAQIDALTTQQSSITLEKTDVQSQLIAATKHLQEADANLATAEATLSQTGLTLEQKQAALHAVDAALIQAMNSVNAADSALKEATDLIAHDTKQMNIFQGKLNAAIRQRSQFSPRSGMYWALSNTVNNLQSHVTGNARRVKNGTAALPPLQDRSGAAHANLASMQLKKATADADVAAAQQQYDGAFAVDVSAKGTRDSAQETVDGLTGRLSSLEDSYDSITQELNNTVAQKTALEQADTPTPVYGPATPDANEVTNAEESDALVQSLTASVTAALSEESEKIGYAKMFVSHQGNVFTVRFRNPGILTNIEVKIDNNDGSFDYRGTDATAPVKDGSYSFTMNRRANAGSQGIRIRMYDPETREVLGEVRANYNNDNGNASIDTVQTSLDTEEQGMLAENPITPMLKVAKIDGPNILLVAQTPHDQFTVWSDTGGILSGATVATPGGTLTGVAQITIDTGAATGYYTIGLYDRQGGEMISSQTLHYDKNAKAITFTDSNAFYTGTTIDTAATSQFDAQHALSTLPLGVPDLNLARIQSIVLYQDTAALAAHYNLYVSGQQMLDAFYAANPGLKPEVLNTLKSPDRENAYALQKTEFRKATDSLNAFEGAMSALMQSAINIYLGAQQGQPERPLKDQFMVKWNTYNQDPKLSYLRGLGIPLPNASLIIGAGKEVYQQHWQYLVDMNADFVAYQGAQSNMLETKRMEDAKGALFGTAGGSHIVIDPSVSVDRIRQAARINDRLKNSTDPRIISYSNTMKQNLALRIATQLPMHPSATDVVNVTTVAMNQTLEELRSSADIHNLGTIQATGHTTPENVHLNLNGTATITFTLQQSAMVNFWTEPGLLQSTNDALLIISPNLSLSLSGSNLPSNYTSNKAGAAGESVSSVLPAGTYTLSVQDTTDYSGLGITPGEQMTMQLPTVPVGINIQTYDNRNIQGRISIPESIKTMPISMKVAEFNNGTRIDDINNLHHLDPNKPIWVVVHGMDSSEKSDPIVAIAKSLQAYSEIQVVTINWADAAKDGIITQDARWTPAVGKWIAQQLVAIGFNPSSINIGGWSHGSYVAYSIAETIYNMTNGEKQINTLVGLDPAGNWPLLSGYEHKIIDFKKFTNNSIVIEGSWMAGSNALAATADVTFQINSLNTNPVQVSTEHSLPATAFAEILEHEHSCPGAFSDYLSLENMLNPAKRRRDYQENNYKSAFEFMIDVSVGSQKGTDSTYPYAYPQSLRYVGSDGIEKTLPLNCEV